MPNLNVLNFCRMHNVNIFILLFSLTLFSCFGSVEKKEHVENAKNQLDEMVYDSILAHEYGADDYGMRKYVMAFLKKGPNRDMSEEESQKLQAAHMKNIGRLADMGKLALAGPFIGDGDLRGIYIFNVPSIAEAEMLTNSDPAIIAGSLKMELVEWYGSAGLMAINDLHERISKIKM